MEVTITVKDGLVPQLNPDLFIDHEVMQAVDPRVFESPLGRWIYVNVSPAKS
jgi:hypothetical protein